MPPNLTKGQCWRNKEGRDEKESKDKGKYSLNLQYDMRSSNTQIVSLVSVFVCLSICVFVLGVFVFVCVVCLSLVCLCLCVLCVCPWSVCLYSMCAQSEAAAVSYPALIER